MTKDQLIEVYKQRHQESDKAMRDHRRARHKSSDPDEKEHHRDLQNHFMTASENYERFIQDLKKLEA